MQLVTSIVLIFISTIILVHSFESDDTFMNQDEYFDFASRYDSSIMSELARALDNIFDGDTFAITDLPVSLADSRIENDIWEFKFTSDLMKLFRGKILIGQSNSLSQIVAVMITLYDDNDNIQRDENGDRMEYSSTARDPGHFLEILREEFSESYAKCRLKLQPNCNFDPRSLFFHFSKSSWKKSQTTFRCTNGIQNQNETDQDCGGICAPKRKCSSGSGCLASSDCISDVCASNICLPTHCGNGQHDNGESDVDCGGPCALGRKCADDKSCNTSCDCESSVCILNMCLPFHCNSATKDGNETGVDCGGACAAKRKCSNYVGCENNTDCVSDSCQSGICEPVNSCFANCTTNIKPLLLITFDSGSNNFSNSTAFALGFSTTQQQATGLNITHGHFAFVNMVPSLFSDWHSGALDHTPNDQGGYMMLINIKGTVPFELFNSTVHGLCAGLCYEFSAYLANIQNLNGTGDLPKVSFAIRESTTPSTSLALSNMGSIPRYNKMTWTNYGLSFIASTSSVVLSIISNNGATGGNDLAIDDIQLRVCSSVPSYFCPPE